MAKTNDLFADDYERDLEENFDKGNSYSIDVEAEKIRQFFTAAKDYLPEFDTKNEKKQ